MPVSVAARQERTDPPDVSGAGATDRVVTFPNAVSSVRLLLVPVFAWLCVASPWRWQATVLLAAIGATDFVDGWYARRFGQVTTVGKVLDPVADRLLVFTALLCTVWVGAAPRWLGLVVLAREAFVVIGTGLVSLAGGRRIDVQWSGKVAAFALMVAFPSFLASTAPSMGPRPAWSTLAWTAAAVGVLFGYLSLVGYVRAGVRSLRERPANPGFGRRGRQGGDHG